LALLTLLAFPMHADPAAHKALAIAAFMIVLFATEAVDHAVAGFFGVFLFWALKVVPFDEAFSGFSAETPWFLMGAMLLGSVAEKSGLARRLAYWVTAKAGGSYSRLLLGFIVVDFLLTFLVPSGIARVTILGAIAVGTVASLGLAPKSNVGRGLLIVITYAATIFDKMLIAGAASILARGMIEEATGTKVLYSHWFIAYLPCDIITIVACWRLIAWLYPAETSMEGSREHLQAQLRSLGAWRPAEKKALAFLLGAVTLWMTDFIHHVSPAMVGMAIGLLALVPVLGLLDASDLRKLNWGALWFTAAALSMGRVLQKTGGLDVLTGVLGDVIGPYIQSPLSSAVVLYWSAFVYHFFLANETAMLSTSLPVVLDLAKAQGMNPLATGMIWTFAAGGKIFVYQGAVLVVGYSFGHFDARDMLKVGFALTVVESLILMALVPLYWPLIGIL
ncbi:MAG TPA: SLC13 family permease, partial [Vicinamibacteria bacterium]|nr:SLC13 family permease [Vicinamibacteria bacterium]